MIEERIQKALIRIKDALQGIKWARMGAESLRDRGIITRTSIDIDIATDSPYPLIAKKLRDKNIQAPLHSEKGVRKTERRGVLITNIEDIQVDIHFGNGSKLREYEDIVFEKGRITKVETPMISLEDHLIRKLIRYNPADRTDIQEILTSGKVNWGRFDEKLHNLKPSEKNIITRNLEDSKRKT